MKIYFYTSIIAGCFLITTNAQPKEITNKFIWCTTSGEPSPLTGSCLPIPLTYGDTKHTQDNRVAVVPGNECSTTLVGELKQPDRVDSAGGGAFTATLTDLDLRANGNNGNIQKTFSVCFSAAQAYPNYNTKVASIIFKQAVPELSEKLCLSGDLCVVQFVHASTVTTSDKAVYGICKDVKKGDSVLSITEGSISVPLPNGPSIVGTTICVCRSITGAECPVTLEDADEKTLDMFRTPYQVEKTLIGVIPWEYSIKECVAGQPCSFGGKISWANPQHTKVRLIDTILGGGTCQGTFIKPDEVSTYSIENENFDLTAWNDKVQITFICLCYGENDCDDETSFYSKVGVMTFVPWEFTTINCFRGQSCHVGGAYENALTSDIVRLELTMLHVEATYTNTESQEGFHVTPTEVGHFLMGFCSPDEKRQCTKLYHFAVSVNWVNVLPFTDESKSCVIGQEEPCAIAVTYPEAAITQHVKLTPERCSLDAIVGDSIPWASGKGFQLPVTKAGEYQICYCDGDCLTGGSPDNSKYRSIGVLSILPFTPVTQSCQVKNTSCKFGSAYSEADPSKDFVLLFRGSVCGGFDDVVDVSPSPYATDGFDISHVIDIGTFTVCFCSLNTNPSNSTSCSGSNTGKFNQKVATITMYPPKQIEGVKCFPGESDCKFTMETFNGGLQDDRVMMTDESCGSQTDGGLALYSKDRESASFTFELDIPPTTPEKQYNICMCINSADHPCLPSTSNIFQYDVGSLVITAKVIAPPDSDETDKETEGETVPKPDPDDSDETDVGGSACDKTSAVFSFLLVAFLIF